METRKLTVGLATFGALVIVYVIYATFMPTPQISPSEQEPSKAMRDMNVKPSQMGTIGKSKIITDSTEFIDRDENGNIIRKWGYKGVSVTPSEGESVWEVLNPFVLMMLPELTLHINADKGTIRLDEEQESPFPKDATFSGNVVIQVEPDPNSTLEASRTELENIVFLSTRSLISSSGTIRFESESVQLEGRGLECVYNMGQRYIEYFWLHELDHLQVKMPKDKIFHSFDAKANAAVEEAVENPVDVNDTPTFSVARALVPEFYRCRIRGNAQVTSPKQVVYAQEAIELYDLPWPDKALSQWRQQSVVEANDVNDPNTPRVVADEKTAPEEEKLVDVVITCDRGILFAPHDVNVASIDPCGLQGLVTRWPTSADVNDLTDEQSLFHIREVRHSLKERDTTAAGPLELAFPLDELQVLDVNETMIPLKITATEQARYIRADDRILFEGDSACTLIREDPNYTQRFVLEAPRLAIDLPSDEANKEMQAIAAGDKLEHIRADGGKVVLQITTKVRVSDVNDPNNTILSGAEMECRECDYDPTPNHETFVALGPGMIRLKNNPTQARSAEDERPFVAFLRDFENLTYYVAEDRIVAEGSHQQMLFDYFPQVDGRYDQHIKAQANHVEITMLTDDTGRRELGSVEAIGGVFYDDDQQQLAASGLFYDHYRHELKMWGTDDQPCFANGVQVKSLILNLKTGYLAVDPIGVGSVPVNLKSQ